MKPFDYEFEAAGKKYVLRNSFAARRNFERKHKKSVPGILKRLTDPDTQTADELIDLFMLLLSTDHPDISPEQIVTLIDELGGDDNAMTVLSDVFGAQAQPANPT